VPAAGKFEKLAADRSLGNEGNDVKLQARNVDCRGNSWNGPRRSQDMAYYVLTFHSHLKRGNSFDYEIECSILSNEKSDPYTFNNQIH
jgi:hypothetical protein